LGTCLLSGFAVSAKYAPVNSFKFHFGKIEFNSQLFFTADLEIICNCLPEVQKLVITSN
jgi:hypothetical protein